MRRARYAGLVCAAMLLAAACGSETTTTTAPSTTTGDSTTTAPGTRPPSATATSAPALPAFATAPVSVAGEGETALLTAVRAAAQNGFDRVTFEFANSLPGYAVGYVDRPIIQDASGAEVAVAGAAVLRLVMAPASGADLAAGGVATYAGPKRLEPGTPVLAEVVQTGDFEGHLTWVIGVRAEAGFHLSTLESPPRLVVDIESG